MLDVLQNYKEDKKYVYSKHGVGVGGIKLYLNAKIDWAYSEKFKEHFINPRNFLEDEESYRMMQGMWVI